MHTRHSYVGYEKKRANFQIWANDNNCDLWCIMSNEKENLRNRIENVKINSINWEHWICVMCKRFFRLPIPQLERLKSPNKSPLCAWVTECQKLIFLLGRCLCWMLNVVCTVFCGCVVKWEDTYYITTYIALYYYKSYWEWIR